MSTRSVIAVPHKDSWRGRYCHYDGYPSGVGVELQRIYTEVFQGDLEIMKKHLTIHHHEWADLRDLEDDQPESQVVPHVGRAQKTDDNSWITRDGDDWGTEWAYVMKPEGIVVYQRIWDTSPKRWHERGLVYWADTLTMERIC
jgi:hypothetical protein